MGAPLTDARRRQRHNEGHRAFYAGEARRAIALGHNPGPWEEAADAAGRAAAFWAGEAAGLRWLARERAAGRLS